MSTLTILSVRSGLRRPPRSGRKFRRRPLIRRLRLLPAVAIDEVEQKPDWRLRRKTIPVCIDDIQPSRHKGTTTFSSRTPSGAEGPPEDQGTRAPETQPPDNPRVRPESSTSTAPYSTFLDTV